MFELVALVQLGIVERARLPHSPHDFHPALPEAAQRARVALAIGAVLAIIRAGPGGLRDAEASPLLHGMAQPCVARAAHERAMHLARLVTDRRGARIALQRFGGR